jgi:protein-disulfide isomerase
VLRLVPATVDVAGRGEDAQVAVAIGTVLRDRVAGIGDVDAVVAVPLGVVLREEVSRRPDDALDAAVYADSQCPYCRQWDEGELPGIVDEHVRAGEVRVVFSDLDSPEVDRQMEDARVSAVEAGVNSTPSFQVGPTGGALAIVGQQDLNEALTQ